MDPRLEIRLADTYAKCATCAYYRGGTHGDCSLWTIRVLDLSICSAWKERTELEAVSK